MYTYLICNNYYFDMFAYISMYSIYNVDCLAIQKYVFNIFIIFAESLGSFKQHNVSSLSMYMYFLRRKTVSCITNILIIVRTLRI